MKNILNKIEIPKDYFNYNNLLTNDLFFYLYDNLYVENYNILSSNLQLALKNNLNEKYIK
jgi:hypothetical protein